MSQPTPRKDEMVFLQVRLPKYLRDEFIALTRARDDSASRVIRGWIRGYIEKEQQPDLFNVDEAEDKEA